MKECAIITALWLCPSLQANVFTLIAVTGVILYWRGESTLKSLFGRHWDTHALLTSCGVCMPHIGVWSLWDSVFGVSDVSALCSAVLGLTIMLTIRITNAPLAQGLPGG